MTTKPEKDIKGIINKLSSGDQQIIAAIGEIMSDGSSREALVKDPAKVLKEHGVEIEKGKTVVILRPGQNPPDRDESKVYLRLPSDEELANAKKTELTDEDLDNVVGGFGFCAAFAVIGVAAIVGTVATTAIVAVGGLINSMDKRRTGG